MLAAAHRLRLRADFSTAVRAGRRASRGVLVVHLLVPVIGLPASAVADDGTAVDNEIEVVTGSSSPDRSDPPARAGFIVSRAVGGAIVRNRVKRRLRHLVREHLAQLPPGATLVVRALPNAGSRQYRNLKEDLDAALTSARRVRSTEASRRGRSAEASRGRAEVRR